MVFPDKPYVTFDDKDTREIATSAPKDFLLAFPNGAIFDEAQKVPEIFEALKQRVDEESYKPGKYILTGSSQFRLKNNMTDSLAGRATFLNLLPFSIGELKNAGLLTDNPYETAYKGLYPPLYDEKKHFLPSDWFEGYIGTYIDIDVKDQINTINISSFKKLIQLCATMSGQTLSMSSLSNGLGISIPTVKSWLSILEASSIIHLLEPETNNMGKALVKTPKLYFIDSGLLCHLLRLESKEELILSKSKGAVIETLAVSELLKSRLNQGKSPNLTFYRDRNGLEVDIIADWKQDFAIEVKSDSGFEKRHASGVRKYLAQKQDVTKGAVFYLGDTEYNVDGISYVPWKKWPDFCTKDSNKQERTPDFEG